MDRTQNWPLILSVFMIPVPAMFKIMLNFMKKWKCNVDIYTQNPSFEFNDFLKLLEFQVPCFCKHITMEPGM